LATQQIVHIASIWMAFRCTMEIVEEFNNEFYQPIQVNKAEERSGCLVIKWILHRGCRNSLRREVPLNPHQNRSLYIPTE